MGLVNATREALRQVRGGPPLATRCLVGQQSPDAAYQLLGRMGHLDQELLHPQVGVVVQEHAAGRAAVATAPADLLVVGLGGARQVVVDDDPDIRLVHAHAERAGGHHAAHPVGHETVLDAATAVGVHARVVGGGVDPAAPQGLSHLLRPTPRGAVDEGRATLGGGVAQVSRGDLGLVSGTPDALDAQEEVRPAEAAHELGRVRQPEPQSDVLAHLGRGGGGAGEHGRRPEGSHRGSEAQVVGPEVVAPLADAVGLIDSHERRTGALQGGTEAGGPEALRGDVDETVEAPGEVVETGCLLVPGDRRVHERRRDAGGLEGVHLVLHERDQRRDDQGDPAQDERRHLVADALARAGRHDRHGVPAGQQRIDGLALARPEGGVAEDVAEDLIRGAGAHEALTRKRRAGCNQLILRGSGGRDVA